MTTIQKITLRVATLLTTISLTQSLCAQEYSRLDACVDFRINSAIIDEGYNDNSQLTQSVEELINTISNDPAAEIISVEICGSASPDGPAEINRQLSHARMMALSDYLRRRIEIPDSVVVYNDKYIAWEHLTELISDDPEPVKHKSSLLAILSQDNRVGYDWLGRQQDGRINAIWSLDDGSTWSELSRRYFAKMRNACFIVVCIRRVEPTPEPEPIIEHIPEADVVVEEEYQILDTQPTQERLTPLINIKINGLEAAALIANIGMELRLTPRLSLDVIGHYSPYDYFNHARKVRVMAIQPELRYWWGEPLVKGHFIGIHVPIAGFNVQLNDKYRYQDPNHALWGVGISYGYAMPLGKSSRWGVEFTIGVGYMDITYDTYDGGCNGRYLNTKTKNYFGPTRLGIDFSYRFDIKSNSKSKTSPK